MTHIRDVTESDFEIIVRLNEAEVRQTSQMDLDRLGQLVRMSSYCKVATFEGRVVAFVVALRENAPYENDNYKWFASRFPSFLYVDRIVVSKDFSGHKIGTNLYRDMFEFARLHGIGTVTCEYNLDPPNPASQAFHDKFGFTEVGTQRVADGTKLVSLQAAET